MGKLTKARKAMLRHLLDSGRFVATGPNKAICNKLVRLGLAEVIGSNPTAAATYAITPAGRSALSQGEKP